MIFNRKTIRYNEGHNSNDHNKNRYTMPIIANVKNVDMNSNLNKANIKVFEMPRIKIIIIDTKVPKNTKTWVKNVGELRNRFPVLIDSIFDGIQSCCDECIKLYQNKISFDKSYNNRKDVSKNDVMDDTENNQFYDDLESLIKINLQLLNAIGVGHSKIDLIKQKAKEFKIHIKLTGAGGGGCCWGLIRPSISTGIKKYYINVRLLLFILVSDTLSIITYNNSSYVIINTYTII